MYIYLIENQINFKVYIGQSEFNAEDSINYFGSGLLISRAIKKYGKENFKKYILCKCSDKNELNIKEKFYISFYKSIFEENCYNLSEGGTGGNSLKYYTEEQLKNFKGKMSVLVSGENNPFFGKTHTEESKQKIRENRKGKNCGSDHHMFGKTHSEELKQKIREKNTGKKKSQELLESLSLMFSGESNPMFGKTHSEESKLKMKNSQIRNIHITCEFCFKTVDDRNFKRWHGDNCKLNPNITEEQLLKRIPVNKKLN